MGRVVEALNGVEWFSSHHGGWGEPQWVRVRLKSGEDRLFLAAQYHREKGAILSFGRKTALGRFQDGYAYCPTLPEVLKSMDVTLEETRSSARQHGK